MLLMNFVIIVPADDAEIIGWNLSGLIDVICGSGVSPIHVYNTMTMIRRYGGIGMSMVITVPADVLALYVYVTPIVMVIVNWNIRLDLIMACLQMAWPIMVENYEELLKLLIVIPIACLLHTQDWN